MPLRFPGCPRATVGPALGSRPNSVWAGRRRGQRARNTLAAGHVLHTARYVIHTWCVKEQPIGDGEDLEAIADEVEAGRGPVALVRPGHRPVVLVSAEEWRRLDELESAESTAWWRRDAAERHEATGKGAHEGEDEPGIDEDEFRRRFAHLFRSTGAA